MAGKKILKFLPKATSFSIPNNGKTNTTNSKIITIVPEEFKEEEEPLSPKVSCMGQVNRKKDEKRKMRKAKTMAKEERKVAKRSSSVIYRMFGWRRKVVSKEEEEEEEVMVTHSAPILVAVEPKKEINIWMRRARAPPIPLQVK